MKKTKQLHVIISIFFLFSTLAFFNVQVNAAADTTPPTFKSVSIDNKIAKEGTEINIAIDAADDGSGLDNYAYIEFKLPSGGYFNTNAKLQDGKYIAKISVSKYTYPGNWKIQSIQLYDKTHNYKSVLNSKLASQYDPKENQMDLSGGDFEIQGTTPDAVKPEFKSITVDKKVASAGSKINVIVDASDNLSGISDLSAQYILDYKKADGSTDRDYQYVQFKQTGSKYTASITVNEYNIRSGKWRLENVNIKDNAGNIRYIPNSKINPNYSDSKDLSSGEFEITGTIVDKNPPALKSVSVSQKTAKAGDSVTLSIDASDDLSGVERAYLYYILPSGETKYLNANLINGKYQTTININNYTQPGKWKIQYIGLQDKANNWNSIYNSKSGQPLQSWQKSQDLSLGDFEIQGTILDTKKPELKTIIVDKKIAKSGDVINISVGITDDISGVKSINAEYVSPSGNTRYVSFKLVDGVYKSTIGINNYTEAGVWKIQSIYLSDNAENSIRIYNSKLPKEDWWKNFKDFSAYNFEVQGTKSDSKPPVVGKVSLDKTTTKSGDKITITVDALDDLSGIDDLQLTYKLPSGSEKHFSLSLVGGKYKLSLPINKYYESGIWKLSYIHGEDKAGNSIHLDSASTDLSSGNFTVQGTTSDSKVPEFKKISIDKKFATSGSKIKITLEATDSLSGIRNAYAYFLTPLGNRRFMNLELMKDGTYQHILDITKYTELGKWKLYELYLVDNAENTSWIYNSKAVTEDYSGEFKDLSSADFEVKGTTSDSKSPEFKSIKLDKTTAKSGDKVTITIEAEDKLSGLSRAYINYKAPSGETKYSSLQVVAANKLQGSLIVDSTYQSGTYELFSITITDKEENSTSIYNAKITPSYYSDTKMNLDGYSIKITAISDTIAPTVKTIAPGNNANAVDTKTYITLTFSEPVQKGTKFSSIVLKDGSKLVPATVTIGDSSITIAPSSALNYKTVYTVLVPAGAVSDLAGNVLKVDYTSKFTTIADTTAPTVQTITPNNKAVTDNKKTSITLTFSEVFQKGTKFTSIVLKDGSKLLLATITYTSTSITIVPKTELSFDKTYTVLVPAGAIKDLAGNDLKADFTSAFTIKPVLVSSISLNDTTVLKGKTVKLIPTIGPSNATNKTLLWSSDKLSIATVDANGNVKGIATGTAKITVKANDGSNKYKTITVTVK
jgi:methionine-rich copper-binding protein CopC